MKYLITITKIETVTRKKTEWEKLYDDEGFDKVYTRDPEAKQYGYVSTEKEEQSEQQVYEQVVEGDINLKAIIDAVNS